MGSNRIDAASKLIQASPAKVYQAFLNPAAVSSWLPPGGMKAEVHLYEPKEGGQFRITLTYMDTDHAAPGKSSDHSDVVQGRFAELSPNERMVWLVDFESEDMRFSGTMKMTWNFKPAAQGTEVIVTAENAPEGIPPEDHEVGLRLTLNKLAEFVEG